MGMKSSSLKQFPTLKASLFSLCTSQAYLGKWRQIEFENTAMMGPGPFKMAEYVQNEFVRLTANKEYFSSPPKVDEVVFQTFENGDCPCTGHQDRPIRHDHWNAKYSRWNPEGWRWYWSGGRRSAVSGITDIVINQVDPENCPTDAGGLCTGHPALRDRGMSVSCDGTCNRQAKADRPDPARFRHSRSDTYSDGLGVWYNNSLEDYEYDVAQANQILDDAGYVDNTTTMAYGEMPDGYQLNFRLNWPSDSIVAPA